MSDDDLRARLTALATERLREHGPHIECNNAGCRRRGLTGMHCGDPCESVHEDCADFAAWTQVLTLLATPAEPARECANPECDHNRTTPSPGCAEPARESDGVSGIAAALAHHGHPIPERITVDGKQVHPRESDGVGLREDERKALSNSLAVRVDFVDEDGNPDYVHEIGYAEHVVPVVEKLIAARVAEAGAKAVEEAADRMPAFHDRDVPEWAITSACRWLRDRARGLRGSDERRR